MSNRIKKIITYIIKIILFVVIALMIMYPFFYAVITSLKTKESFYQNPLGITSDMTFQNYLTIWGNFSVGRKMVNTAIVVFTSTFIILFLSIPTAYFINKISSYPIKKIVFFLLFIFIFIPEEVFIMTEYDMMSSMGLVNNFLSVIIIYSASFLPETILFLCLYFQQIPKEFDEAAKLDGIDDFHYLIHFIIPIARSSILVLAITTIISLWNTFLVPMLLLYDESVKLIMPALSGLITKHSNNPTYQMAGTLISMLPLILIYFLFKNKIFDNTIKGALK